MVERKGDIPNVSFKKLTGGPDAVDVDALRAAVELHRPRLADRWGHPTTDVEKADARYTRCGPCARSVTFAGCETWSTAYPTSADGHVCESNAKCWADPDCPTYSTRTGKNGDAR